MLQKKEGLELGLIFTYDVRPMKNVAKHLKFFMAITNCLMLICLISCGKEKYEIGHGDPQLEIQKCMKLSEKKRFEEAVECLEIFKSKFPMTSFSTEAELSIADNYFNNKEFLLAADAYLMFVKLHPMHTKSDYAYYRLGLSYLRETPKAIDRDQQYLNEAINYLRIAAAAYPSSPYHEAAVNDLKDARSRVARRTYYIGNFYYKTGEYLAAIPRFIDVVNDYPETNIVPISLYKLVVAAGNLKLINEAKLFFSKLTMEHPESKWTKKAEGKLKTYIKRYGSGSQMSAPEQPQTMEEAP